ncbi:MAG TPA: GNAT family N-acetyltransferase, partial [bacterium]|nr:GNAT family N-acetyltransferase [bacterium]
MSDRAPAGPRIARTDEEIEACSAVMRELRPHVPAGEFLARVRAQEADGYRLVYVSDENGPAAVAGFRLGTNLAWGRFLYVDDLVTSAGARSRGYGGVLLRWLENHARAEGCEQVHLDSGLARAAAHRFYRREGMPVSSYHFTKILAGESKLPPARAAAMVEAAIRRFDEPDEVQHFEKGRFETVSVGGMQLGRAVYEPGWKWSEHIAPAAGTPLCGVEHVGLVLHGTAAVAFEDGTRATLRAGDV